MQIRLPDMGLRMYKSNMYQSVNRSISIHNCLFITAPLSAPGVNVCVNRMNGMEV